MTAGRQAGAQSKDSAGGGTKPRRPLAGFLIAGASLAALFGLAALKGRVKNGHTDNGRN